MLVKSSVFICIFAFVFKDILGRPSVDSGADPLSICYSLNCPPGTTICGKHSEISFEDRTKLNVQIRCYDDEGDILKSKNSTEDNPFSPDIYYKGSKLSAVIRLVPKDFYGTDTDNDPEVSYVPLRINYPSFPKAETGPKSEVEDLNSR